MFNSKPLFSKIDNTSNKSKLRNFFRQELSKSADGVQRLLFWKCTIRRNEMGLPKAPKNVIIWYCSNACDPLAYRALSDISLIIMW